MTAVRPERAQGQPSHPDGSRPAAGGGGIPPAEPAYPGNPGGAALPPRPADPAAEPGQAGWTAYPEQPYDPSYLPGPQYRTPVYESPAGPPGYPQPGARPAAEPRTAPAHPAGPEPAPTATLPVLTEADYAPGPAAAEEAHAVPQGTGTGPVPGGRAARRQAAKHGGRRARTVPAAPPADPEQPRPPMSRVEARRAARAAKDSPAVVISRVVGELFISLGVLMLLFVTYQLWYSNILADETAGSAEQRLQQQWAANTGGSDARNPGAFAPGQGFAIIYIPKLDVKAPIAEGVDEQTILNKGMVGHYSGAMETAMPWDKTGNFALAGHRNTHGEPFRYINTLVPGDKVIVETASTYYTYQVTSMLPQTSPSNVAVIDPVPVGSGFTQPGRYITLTTCTPEFTSLYRLIVWGKMVAEQPRTAGPPAALTQG